MRYWFALHLLSALLACLTTLAGDRHNKRKSLYVALVCPSSLVTEKELKGASFTVCASMINMITCAHIARIMQHNLGGPKAAK
jgi:hypothetical protein